jgi:hypothetical protein
VKKKIDFLVIVGFLSQDQDCSVFDNVTVNNLQLEGIDLAWSTDLGEKGEDIRPGMPLITFRYNGHARIRLFRTISNTSPSARVFKSVITKWNDVIVVFVHEVLMMSLMFVTPMMILMAGVRDFFDIFDDLVFLHKYLLVYLLVDPPHPR